MLVYGDHDERVATSDYLARLTVQGRALAQEARGVAWHQACVALFIAGAGLLQAVADAAFDLAGEDTPSPTSDRLMEWLRDVALAIDCSWRSGFADQRVPDPLPYLDAAALPKALTVRACEGYAYYALYPELYLTAARALPKGAVVIGLRSIGTGLAALVAAVCEADCVATIRPVGDPYDRRVSLGANLAATLRAQADRVFALVDEGPGQSGSSFAGAADALEALGVPRERIVFLPSHPGDPGDHAPPGWRTRWRAAQRLTAAFDDVVLAPDAPAPLAEWFADVTGPATQPLADLSGGLWRQVAGRDAPADPGREARKYLLTTPQGRFRLKFVGIGPAAADKLVRSQQLAEAGFTPEPLALRYGFLAERWLEGTAPPPERIWPRVAPYLRFRAATFPAATAGASLADLIAMARYNATVALDVDEAWSAEWSPARLAALARCVQPVQVDGRLHPWEWIEADGAVLKTDATDHASGHDLIGCQDIAWDVAGAIVELSPSREEADALAAAVLGERPGARDLLRLMIPCYLAFQLGWWSFGCEASSRDGQRDAYRRRWQALVADPDQAIAVDR